MNKLIIPNHFPVKREGLVAWYSYRNSGSIATTGTWKDYSGNANDGTLNNGAVVNNKGLSLNGTLDNVLVPSSASIEFGNVSFSMSAWIKMTTALTSQISVISNYHGTTEFVLLGSSGGNAFWQTRDSTGNLISLSCGATVNDNEWHYLSGIRDTTNNLIKLYVDGILENSAVDTRTGNFISSNNQYQIGSGNNSFYFPGFIDDVMIFNRDLPPGEIKANYLKNKRN